MNFDNKELIQNLKDVNCCAEFIEKFLQSDNKVKLKLLAQQRKYLLDELHASQRRINCLDYLMYKLKE